MRRLFLKTIYILLVIICFFLSSFQEEDRIELRKASIDSLQFPIGYPNPTFSAIEQLQNFPSPRFAPRNKLIRLFNWADPLYMGGNGQGGISKQQAVINAVNLQEELALNWNYNIVIPNSKMAGSEAAFKAVANPTLSYINLANKYPDVPLGVITFWGQTNPSVAGYNYKKAIIMNKQLDNTYYIHYKKKGKNGKVIGFNLPDSLIAIDGHTQKFYLQNIISKLTRPINMLNENGEEPPGAEMINEIKQDSAMKKKKDSLGISDWAVFAGKQKLRMRNKYSSCFMNEIPELQNTNFTYYAIDGGQQNRFLWYIMKKCQSKINGQYYSTPDFYPRWPYYWRDGKTAWHGWNWINACRKKEISEKDILFSPFIAPGWSKNSEEDIRPSQWLGLLKWISVTGAEFFYVGYFNGSKPNNPRQYAWQMAIASYAQGVTSRYEDELRNGNLLMDEKKYAITRIKTNDPRVLLVVRKHNKKNRYIICASLQPFSNNKGEVADKKIITVEFDSLKLILEVRKQGSVYVFDNSDEIKPVFYQLDSWHEPTHPDYWSKNYYTEAEVQDDTIKLQIFTEGKAILTSDFSSFTSFITIKNSEQIKYFISQRDSKNKKYFYVLCRSNQTSELSILFNDVQTKKSLKSQTWKWVEFELNNNKNSAPIFKNEFLLKSLKGEVDIDKIIISSTPVKIFSSYQ